MVPIGFLAIPKCWFVFSLLYFGLGADKNSFTADRKHNDDTAFRIFKRQLYHSSISAILSTLRPAMTKPAVRRCPDGHYRRVIYDLASFIADYPEQVFLAGIVQNWCAKSGFVSFCTGNVLTTSPIDVRLSQMILMALEGIKHEHLQRSYWTRWIPTIYGMNMELMMM